MFGETLKKARTGKGFSRITLARLARIGPDSIYAYEVGKNLPRSTGPILRLSDTLEVDRQVLLSAACADDDVKGGLIW